MGEVLRLTLEGPDAEPGRIPAADVARLLQGYERALARAAEARMRRRARVGRRGGAVESATHLIFRGIERGSLVAVLELPELITSDELGLDDAQLGELASEDLIALLREPEREVGDDRVIEALAQLGDELAIGSRYSALVVEWQRGAGAVERGVLNAETRRHLAGRRAAAAQHPARNDRVVGTLVEADFEERRAHVRTNDLQRIEVTFTDDQADEIHSALRRPGELDGRITYDSRTNTMLSIELRRIIRSEQLQVLLDSEDFWYHRSVDALAAEQGVSATHDLEALADHDATTEELEAFLDALSS